MAEHQFVKLSTALLDHADLDAHELLVYIALLRFRNPKTGTCFPGLQTIADTARISRDTARRAVQRLEDKGIISVERVKAVGAKTNDSNKYTVGLLPDDPMKYLGKSAKGTRVPKRELSAEARKKLAEAARRSNGSHPLGGSSSEPLPSSGSEPLPQNTPESSSGSELVGSGSEPRGVVAGSHGKKINLKKINEVDITPVSDGVRFPEVSFDSQKDELASEKQVTYIKDLAIHLNYEAGNGTPNDLHVARWRKLTRTEADNLIRQYLKALGRPDEIYYPQSGTPEYEALSSAGKEFADTGGMPDSVFEYGFKLKENTA